MGDVQQQHPRSHENGVTWRFSNCTAIGDTMLDKSGFSFPTSQTICTSYRRFFCRTSPPGRLSINLLLGQKFGMDLQNVIFRQEKKLGENRVTSCSKGESPNDAMGLIRTRNLSISQPVYDTISGLKCDNQFLYAHVTGNFMKWRWYEHKRNPSVLPSHSSRAIVTAAPFATSYSSTSSLRRRAFMVTCTSSIYAIL